MWLIDCMQFIAKMISFIGESFIEFFDFIFNLPDLLTGIGGITVLPFVGSFFTLFVIGYTLLIIGRKAN